MEKLLIRTQAQFTNAEKTVGGSLEDTAKGGKLAGQGQVTAIDKSTP